MSLRHATAAAVLCLLAGSTHGQSIQTYVQTANGAGQRALGYPVPLPVASLTPVDGFRDYASLDARLRSLDLDSSDLEGVDIGTTMNSRRLRAYRVSDADGVDVEGRPEAAFFINAGIHAREWAAPEVSTFLVERMVNSANDQGLVRYLLDNTRLVIIPVHNVDGLLQTQRFPTQVVVGRDPRSPADWPRDGRMRRKNMRVVDEQLTTFADHLGGIDLNRNHPPFWGTTTQGGTLTNPDELVYRGTGPHSEFENIALRSAAALGPESRIRLGIDVHSHSRVFFSSNTARSRLNQIQARLISVMSQHHLLVPTASGAPNNKLYTDIPDPPNSGIGAAAEYFAYQWLVPSWTLELEPANSAAEYGGTNDSHGGFILPASQVKRVREAWAETHLVAFYFMAGPAHLREVRILDAGSGALLQRQRWSLDPASGRRVLSSDRLLDAVAGQRLRAELVFNKPMRYRNATGQIASLPGLNIPSAPQVSLRQGAQVSSLDTAGGQWLAESGFAQYRDDTFRFEFNASGSGASALVVNTTDMVGLPLDADPATPVDWAEGAWSRWESGPGIEGDVGGADAVTSAFSVLSGGSASAVTLRTPPAAAGEGDALRVVLERGGDLAAGAVIIQGSVDGAAPQRVIWQAGEGGPRTLSLPLADDVQVQGERALSYRIESLESSGAVLLRSGSVQVLDNDRSDAIVVRAGADLQSALALHSTGNAATRELVLDGAREYRVADSMLTVCQPFEIEAPVVVHGNRARITGNSANCFGPRITASGRADLRDLYISGGEGNFPTVSGIEALEAELTLDRVIVDGGVGFLIKAPRSLRLRRSSLQRIDVDEPTQQAEMISATRSASIEASTVLGKIGSWAATAISLSPNGGQPSTVNLSTLHGTSTSLPFLLTGVGIAEGSLRVSRSLVQETEPFIEISPPNPNPPLLCRGVVDAGSNYYSHSLGTGDCPFSSAPRLDLGAPRGADSAYVLPAAALVDAAGTECVGVDQRGAPRPQSTTGTPRCDIGAIEVGLNPWRGFWIPARPGHGIDMQTVGNVLFILWYTFGDDGQPVAYQAAAPLSDPTWTADLLLARRNPANGAITNTRVGSVGIDFSSDVQATLRWRFDARGVDGSEALSALAFAAGEPRVEVTGTWFPPAESGNGASIARRGETTAMALYYYDAAGNLRWALGAGDANDVSAIELSSYTGFCPDCSATANPLRSVVAGQARLQMLTPQRIRVNSDITYPGAAGGRWQRSGADFVPINDPVDNRDAAAQLPAR